jgi:hypothetical protein
MLTGLVLCTAAPVFAQARHDIATDRATLQADRQAIVAANLPLTDAQAKTFWPMYNEYRGELGKLGDRYVDLVLDYAKNDPTLTDAQASGMLDEFFNIQKEELKIKTSWAPKFRKALPGKVVTRFYQIENKLDAIVRFDAADQIPLVELQKKAE